MFAFWNQNIFRESPTSPPARLGVCPKHALYLSRQRGTVRSVASSWGLSPGPSTRVPEGSRSFLFGRICCGGKMGFICLSAKRPEDNRDPGDVWGLGGEGIPLLGQIEGTVLRRSSWEGRCGTWLQSPAGNPSPACHSLPASLPGETQGKVPGRWSTHPLPMCWWRKGTDTFQFRYRRREELEGREGRRGEGGEGQMVGGWVGFSLPVPGFFEELLKEGFIV